MAATASIATVHSLSYLLQFRIALCSVIHICCDSGSLYVLLFISAAIQDRSMFCYSYLLRFRIAYCYVIHIDCHTGFLPVLLLPCLPSYLLLSVEKMKILSLPILLLPCLPYIRRIPDCGLTSVPDDRLTDDTLVLHHFFSPFIR